MSRLPPVSRLLVRMAAGSVVLVLAEAGAAVLTPTPDLDDSDASGTVGDPRAPEVHIGAVGDSTTTGPGLDSAEDIWLKVLARRIAVAGHHVRISSFAVSGATTGDVIATQLPALAALGNPPSYVFVAAGSNDVLHGRRIGRMEHNLSVIVEEILGSGSTPILCGVGDLGTIPRFRPPLSWVMSARARQADAAHRRVSERFDVPKVRVFEATATAFRADPSTMFSADRFHPSAAGHRLWAEAAGAAIGLP